MSLYYGALDRLETNEIELNNVSEKIAQLEPVVNDMFERMIIVKTMNDAIASFKGKLETLYTQLTSADDKVTKADEEYGKAIESKIKSNVTDANKKLGIAEDEVTKIESQIQECEGKIADLEKRVDESANDLIKLDEDQKHLSRLREDRSKLEKAINDDKELVNKLSPQPLVTAPEQPQYAIPQQPTIPNPIEVEVVERDYGWDYLAQD